MKTLVRAAALGSLLCAAPFALADLESEEARLGYSLGVTLGQSLVQDVDDLDIEAFTQAIRDVYADAELALSEEEMAETLMQFQQQAMAERQAEAQRQTEAAREAGETFLAENALNEDVVVTDSGLQYKVIESGDGATPGPDSQVEVHYEGTLLDGSVFDSSYERGEPISFRVNQVIEGWQEALQLMSVGDTWMLYLPYDLAYGEAGTGGPIGPYETLTFKVELLGVDEEPDAE